MTHHRVSLLAVAALAGLVWAAGCGDGATEPPAPPPDPPRPTTVTVSPSTAELTAVGATVQLTAEVRDQNGNAMAGATVTWASGAPAVATVSSAGLVTAAGNGTATITATAGPASGTATVTVAQEVSAVAVSPAVDTLVAGDTLRLAAEAADANGHPVPGAEFSWASGDTAVATVDSAGLVTGVRAGEVEISAWSSGVAGVAALAVVAPVPATVAVEPDTAAFSALGDSVRLAAEVRDQIGRVMDDVQVSWSSADTTVAIVDSAGLVTAAGGGATTVSAMAGEVSGEAVVTVMQSASSVVVTPGSDTVTLGDTLRLAAEAFDENGHTVAGAVFNWSSSNLSVAGVDDAGLVTGNREGLATITTTVGDAHGTSEITVETPDRAALVALYHATDGANWVNNENWLTDGALGEWYGVDTDDSGRVVVLDLSGQWDEEAEEYIPNGLSGPIPPEIGNLFGLTELSLWVNELEGPIPPEIGNLANLEVLNLGGNELEGPIPNELGNLARLRTLNLGWNGGINGPVPVELGKLSMLTNLQLYQNRLTGPIPNELGNLTQLRTLNLGNNLLSGPVPNELGNLTNLSSLYIGLNHLTGLIPRSFLQLNLRRFVFQPWRNSPVADLCAPGTVDFSDWIEEIESHWGPFCNDADREALESLFETTGGPGWTNTEGWLGGAVLANWHGIRADSLGRVTALDLSRNGLAGRLPGSLGQLAHMTELRIADNADLTGRLPLSLADIALRALHYAGTDLCAPVNTPFRDWLSSIPSHDGTGAECPLLSDREILEALYDATGGPGWTHNENWLTDAPLGEWYGVEADDQGRVVRIWFLANSLTGRIPRELGDMVHLQSLGLYRNRLTGPIPRELGGLANLRSLSLGENNLSGSIPPELGSLANLRSLSLHENDLTGPIPVELADLTYLGRLDLTANGLSGRIPPEIGGLANLHTLNLGRNELTGPIPPELGGLANLRNLNLATNRLSGGIPTELGGLIHLTRLYLGDNEFMGPLPPEFDGLTRLRTLALQTNADMSGALPISLINLAGLESLQTGGTGLCAPSDAAFLEWLESVANRRVARCEGEPAMAYLVQAVQSRDFPVPLVAGEEALLRVFVTASGDNSESLPPVRASFHLNDALVHVADIPEGPGPIPTEVGEGSLATSASAVIPPEVVRPGLEMVVQVDPDGTLDVGLGVARRIPATGRAAVDVRDMPVFDLTLVPFLWTEDPDSAVLESVDGMAADPEGHELLDFTRTLLPVGDLTVTAHEPVRSSSNNAYDLIAETRAIRTMEGGTGYYMGTMSGDITGAAGLGGGVASFSVPRARVIAHEFGHNFGLPHAPCGGAGGPDPAYPNADGTIGAWGFDFHAGGLVPPTRNDIMGYCPDNWISDYFFTKALHFRLASEGAAPATVAVAEARSLLLWGGADSTGTPHLKPAFIVDAPAALPNSAGQHRITGRTAGGAELFSFSFTMPETADGDGSSSFAFALPVRSGWASSLASITLASPSASFTLSGDSDFPMTILRNPRTGQVTGILRDLPPATQVAMDAAGQAGGAELEMLFSRGIPGAEEWRR